MATHGEANAPTAGTGNLIQDYNASNIILGTAWTPGTTSNGTVLHRFKFNQSANTLFGTSTGSKNLSLVDVQLTNIPARQLMNVDYNSYVAWSILNSGSTSLSTFDLDGGPENPIVHNFLVANNTGYGLGIGLTASTGLQSATIGQVAVLNQSQTEIELARAL